MKKRNIMASLALSATALISLATYEGYREEAYIPVPGDVPTIGFGTTEGVKMGDTTTPERAMIRLLSDARKYEQAVKRCVKVPLRSYEYDAFVSLAYNIGPYAFCTSTLVKKVNMGDYKGACAEIDRWVYQNGKPLKGLIKRRAKERATCEGRDFE